MKYINEFREPNVAIALAGKIKAEANPAKQYRLMEFCGGHTHTIFRHGIQDLVPANVRFIHGPGCPVCVLPMGRIDGVIELVQSHDVIVCTYGDVMRVPASNRNNLHKTKARGGDIRMVYSALDVLEVARQNPQREVVFFAIGFETTTPPTAVLIERIKKLNIKNLSVICNHVITPAALLALLTCDYSEQIQFNGILGPSHVSTIIGISPYQNIAAQYHKPIVIAGFEPLDVLQSALMLIRQINESRADVENEYSRAVSNGGNRQAMDLIDRVFTLRESFEWRGLGRLPHSALKIRPEYVEFDAECRFEFNDTSGKEIKGCECPAILRGQKTPRDCKLFGSVCRPDNAMGACMVSSEGACAAEWAYGRHRQSTVTNRFS